MNLGLKTWIVFFLLLTVFWAGLLIGYTRPAHAEILILEVPISANETPRTLSAYHPSATTNSEVCQFFTVPADFNYHLDRAVFEIDRLSSSVSVRLRSTLHSSFTGTYGSTAVPSDTNSPVATSDWVLASSIPAGSRNLISFRYSTSPVLTKNTQYAVTVQMDTTGTIDLGYNVYFDLDNGYGGNECTYSGSAYEGGANDHGIQLYGSKIETFTGGGTTGDNQPLTDPGTLPTGPLAGGIGALVILAGFVAFAFSRRRGR